MKADVDTAQLLTYPLPYMNLKLIHIALNTSVALVVTGGMVAIISLI